VRTRAASFLAIGFAMGWDVLAHAQDSPETIREQQKALAAESGAAVPVAPGAVTSSAPHQGLDGLLFVGVDDVAIPTYVIDPANNNTQPAFTGFQIWGAAVISGISPGDAVVYFNSGTTLHRYQSPGPPTLCCTLTFNGNATSVVSVAYNSTAGRLLFTKNIATEAVYSLPVTPGACPASCALTQDIVYSAANNDMGGLAFDAATGNLYGTNDDASPGPAGVYEINGDGTTTLVVAYPAGEDDIDGLAFDNGKLYLVTDEPGSIYVYNLGTGLFEAPLTNPWTTSETFSGAGAGTGLVIPVELQGFTVE
jgi:hypothetical protein